MKWIELFTGRKEKQKPPRTQPSCGISPAARVFSRVFLRSGMAKTRCQEYITFAVVLRRFVHNLAPLRVWEKKGSTMTMRWLTLMVLLSLLIALALPPMAAAQSAADTYKTKCAICHGPDGKGKSAMGTKDLAGADIQKMSDADLTAAITNGKGKMPAYKGKLTDDQVKDMVAYVRSLKK